MMKIRVKYSVHLVQSLKSGRSNQKSMGSVERTLFTRDSLGTSHLDKSSALIASIARLSDVERSTLPNVLKGMYFKRSCSTLSG